MSHRGKIARYSRENSSLLPWRRVYRINAYVDTKISTEYSDNDVSNVLTVSSNV